MLRSRHSTPPMSLRVRGGLAERRQTDGGGDTSRLLPSRLEWSERSPGGRCQIKWRGGWKGVGGRLAGDGRISRRVYTVADLVCRSTKLYPPPPPSAHHPWDWFTYSAGGGENIRKCACRSHGATERSVAFAWEEGVKSACTSCGELWETRRPAGGVPEEVTAGRKSTRICHKQAVYHSVHLEGDRSWGGMMSGAREGVNSSQGFRAAVADV